MTILLRIEAACYALAALVAYWHFGFSWWLYVALWLVPDVSMVGYLAGPRIGAMAYNVMHHTAPPWVLLAAALAFNVPLATAIALIWFSHIGIDRALGYGLKHFSGFKVTHLGTIGRS